MSLCASAASVALNDISFDIRKGEIRAIIGPNGAGKSRRCSMSSTASTIPQEGDHHLPAESSGASQMQPHQVARKRHRANLPEHCPVRTACPTLDNIMSGAADLKMTSQHSRSGRCCISVLRRNARRSENHRKVVEEIIDFLEIQRIRKTPVGRLPYGLKKRVELARALAAEPKLLLLDEPMAGMNVEEKEDMSRFILEVNQEFGTTIALIEHDMGVVMDLADRVVVMDYGKQDRRRHTGRGAQQSGEVIERVSGGEHMT